MDATADSATTGTLETDTARSTSAAGDSISDGDAGLEADAGDAATRTDAPVATAPRGEAATPNAPDSGPAPGSADLPTTSAPTDGGAPDGARGDQPQDATPGAEPGAGNTEAESQTEVVEPGVEEGEPTVTEMPAQDTDLVTGTGATCSPTADRTADHCGSYYCGVSLESLAAALDSTKACHLGAETMCNGTPLLLVSDCGWTNVVGGEDEVDSCIRNGINRGDYPESCMNCLINASVCAAERCVSGCLGSAERCDRCLRESGCFQTLFACAEWPDPL